MQKTKAQIRKEIKETFSTKDSNELEKESKRICSDFLQTDLYKESKIILSYMAMKKEASPKDITEAALKDGKKVALPRTILHTSDMDFYILKNSLPLEEIGRAHV